MIIELASPIRKSYVQALSNIVIDSVTIPVFDEIVNGKTANVRGSEAYIVLQGQTESDNAIQNFCTYRQNAFITVRIVTKYLTGGNKLLSEQIAQLIHNAIRSGRDDHKLISEELTIQSVIFEGSNTLTEQAGNKNAFSKILNFNNIINT